MAVSDVAIARNAVKQSSKLEFHFRSHVIRAKRSPNLNRG